VAPAAGSPQGPPPKSGVTMQSDWATPPPRLFLARVDGKTPVEYITADADKYRVRRVARALLLAPPARIDAMRQAWTREFTT
jgi:hypothetical protein